MENCIFCKIIKGEIPSSKIYEDENVYAFLDIMPVNYGHTLIIPKMHSDNFLKMRQKDIDVLFEAAQKVADAIKAAVNCDGVNLLMNVDSAAGQVVFHSHLHLIPRFKDDGLKHWPHQKYQDSEHQRVVAEKIVDKF